MRKAVRPTSWANQDSDLMVRHSSVSSRHFSWLLERSGNLKRHTFHSVTRASDSLLFRSALGCPSRQLCWNVWLHNACSKPPDEIFIDVKGARPHIRDFPPQPRVAPEQYEYEAAMPFQVGKANALTSSLAYQANI